ncbi:hypothetical protein B0H11DRAFT_1999428, partial [Mycena galericulata]
LTTTRLKPPLLLLLLLLLHGRRTMHDMYARHPHRGAPIGTSFRRLTRCARHGPLYEPHDSRTPMRHWRRCSNPHDFADMRTGVDVHIG